ncbi:MAG: arylamine N-acetyltransferase [Acidobacteria bacterium]|nr:arylamine N-acetyltransferase [Acidobacteriota bacterium]
MEYFRIAGNGTPRQVLGHVVTAFAGIPYENISKIIKREEAGSAEKARRYPEEVIRNHMDWGSGGTCFSLTCTLAKLVRGLGWEAEYILADRRYGQNTHCALLIWINDVPHILDPGFLIIHPIPVPQNGELEFKTAFNSIVLAAEKNPGNVTLSTIRKGARAYRLTYKTSPVDEGEFFKAWDASFDWDMMHYPLLTRSIASKQIYLNGPCLQVSDADSVERQTISENEFITRIASEFRIHPSLVARAISILKGKGGIGGKTSGR